MDALVDELKHHIVNDLELEEVEPEKIGDDDPLWEAPPKEVLGLVRLALDDPDVIVRQRAAGCLKSLHDEPSRVDLYRRALTDESWRVRQEALIDPAASRN